MIAKDQLAQRPGSPKTDDVISRRLLFVLWLTVTAIVLLPHILTPWMQHAAGLNLIYTPNLLNGSWSRYDDITKLFAVFNLLDNGTLLGHPASPDFGDRFYVSVLTEALTSLFFAPFAEVFGRDVPYYLAPIFTGGCAVAMALLAWPATRDRVVALTAPLIAIFGVPFIHLDQILSWEGFTGYLRQAVMTLPASHYELNSFYRIYQNATSYIVFVLFFHALAKSWDAERFSWRLVFGLTLPLSALFYLYLFFGVAAALMSAFVWFCAAALVPFGGSRPRFAMLTIAGAIGTCVAIPGMLHVLLFVGNATPDWFDRVGITTTHFWAQKELIVLTAIIVILAPNRGWKIALLALLAATLTVENAHWLFGINVQPGHVFVRVTTPLLLLMLICTLARLPHLSALGWLRIPLRVAITVVAVGVTIGAGVFGWAYARNTYSIQGMTADQAALVDWFKNVGGKPVVGTLSPDLDVLLNVHASVYNYTLFSGQNYPAATNAEVEDRVATLAVLGGADAARLREFFAPSGTAVERRLVFFYLGNGYGRADYKSKPMDQAYAALDRALVRVRTDVPAALAAHRLDYVVFGGHTAKSALLSGEGSPYLCPATKIGPYAVFRRRHSNGCGPQAEHEP